MSSEVGTKHGFNVHGLNTAATLWCSAAVGMMAGAGAWQYAVLLTLLVVFVALQGEREERLVELPGDYAAIADYVAAHAVQRG